MKEMDYQFSGAIPVAGEAEVVIVGAGPSGLGAAVVAARLGCRVLVVEKNALPGGMAVSGEVSPFMLNHFGEESMDRPVYEDWVRRMVAYRASATAGWALRRLGRKWGPLYINKNYAALSAEDMLEEAKVSVLYEHALFDVLSDGGRITRLVLLSRNGPVAVQGQIFIDASGDGVLAAKAGCRIAIGDENGECQPMTWCFKVAPVRIPDEDFWQGAWRREIQEAYRRARAEGRLSCPRENLLMFQCSQDGAVHFNTTRVLHHDSTDAASYQEAGVIARRQMRELLQWLRGNARGFADADIVSMGQHLGVRESRRVLGDFCLTEEAFYNRQKFADGIARCNYPIDIHSSHGGGTRYEPMGYDDYYEIPWRCLLPSRPPNLLTAGRIISSDHVINSSLRVMPVACSIGQAAGAGAALALRAGTTPDQVDGVQVRQCLVELGAWLGERPPGP